MKNEKGKVMETKRNATVALIVGAVLLALGLRAAPLIDDPSAYMPAWAVMAFVAVGGGLLLFGLVRTFARR